MSGLLGMLLVVGLLTAIGVGTLVFITVKYYWGDRGTPPLTGEQRRLAREAELRLRAKQIEHSQRNPIAPRSSSFWDNRKVYR